MSQNPLHYAREELLPHLILLMDTDREYADWRIKRTFERAPWMKQEIGADVNRAWAERFGEQRA